MRDQGEAYCLMIHNLKLNYKENNEIYDENKVASKKKWG